MPVNDYVVDTLVNLAKSIKSQRAKRQLRAIAMGEIRDLFADCGIEVVSRSNLGDLGDEDENRRAADNVMNGKPIVLGDLNGQEMIYVREGRKLDAVKCLYKRTKKYGTTLPRTKEFVERWQALFAQ